MFTQGQIEKEVKEVFGDEGIKVMSEYRPNIDGVIIGVSKRINNKIFTIKAAISSLEELEYNGNPLDILRLYINRMYARFEQGLAEVEEETEE